jgi:hypothetical protein
VIRLIGALLLEQNDVYGPPPICKNDHAVMETGLAVVYPALSRGDTAAGPDGIRGSATGQMDELALARIISLASAEPGLTGSPSLCVTLASRSPWERAITFRPPRRRLEMIAAVEDALREVDVLLRASAMDPPSRIDDPTETERTYPRQARTRTFNVTGHPALAMMAGLSSGGLPLSVQFAGRNFAEATLFQVEFGRPRWAKFDDLWRQRSPRYCLDGRYERRLLRMAKF